MHLTTPSNMMRTANRRSVVRGFTLVELMVVLIIISILASIIMFAMFNAQEAARAAKTKNMVSKLNTVVMQRYESYMSRRVPLRPGPNELPMNFAARRLQALREIMRMELPDRWTDVRDDPVTGIQRPAVNRTYFRKLSAANNGAGVNDGDSFQGAECLYMIVVHGAEDADAFTRFSQSDIGDVDNDGLSEFLDGWGRPISFIRWPAGFDSPRQSRNESKDFDQFNHWKNVDRPPTAQPPTPPGLPRRFALFPLVYSGGADKKYDLATGAENASGTAVAVHYSVPAGGATPAFVDPYLTLPNSEIQIGQPNDNDGDGSLDHGDNIHNHDLTIR